MQLTPMTLAGHKKLQQELEHLKKVERPAIIAAIAEARAHGDLKENAEYHAAKEKQGFIEGRIRDLESKLSHCRVIDISQIPNEGKVVFGATVTLVNVHSEEEVIYQIVGEDEADLKHRKISVTSPVARAMIGKMETDEVIVLSPSGEVIYEVVKVEYTV
ncbi:MAG: transcription elongation factor GreA [Gammaproteobacteria bacterium RIFCSPLOWO2_02_FULL_42_14]|nr:MAG: transcription elongation factor GreA [Gammaproteobacteria bacterium RIFCSPHIGHO2_02_FULL_42_43]OGT28632.1 MAG: transcription elongation factor GreA [Gammaproteobacteria bacterium RIFCSPHIGHO2_01_FULL_42_8]OGT52320.1 MAG: transcription elongation factor GreA [Gammaproteobacteria bacterium RIFCSPHIGHO2_12_FULL_41_25]OGT61932.1 MAG: transcription elongation factor GreA [Gammaproteobacteria bacterium RIFCSPLOWO2_02_FULL_42_14]OGT86357.1 MAG: transcription elongation factor GreA [Gammaproteo